MEPEQPQHSGTELGETLHQRHTQVPSTKAEVRAMGESPSLRVLRPQGCAWVRSSHLLRGPLCATTHLDGQRARSVKGREPNQCLGARTPFSSTTLQPVQLRDSEARHVLSVEATAAPPREQTVERQPFWRLKGEGKSCFPLLLGQKPTVMGLHARTPGGMSPHLSNLPRIRFS